VGNGVSVIALGNVAANVAATGVSAFIGAAKHLQGDTTFGVDGDSTSIYQNPALVVVGTALASADFSGSITTNTAAVDNFLVAAGTPVVGWVVK